MANNKPIYCRSIPLNDLNTERYHLSKPLQAETEVYTEEVLGKIVELDLWVSESTESEALSSLKKSICELWEELEKESDEKLGRLPRAWKRILQSRIKTAIESAK